MLHYDLPLFVRLSTMFLLVIFNVITPFLIGSTMPVSKSSISSTQANVPNAANSSNSAEERIAETNGTD